MMNNQNFLVDFMGTKLGKDLKNTDTFNGITKALNYVPNFPEDLKGELKTSAPQGSPYVVVVPIRKDADWWLMPQDARTAHRLPMSRSSSMTSICRAIETSAPSKDGGWFCSTVLVTKASQSCV